MTALGGTVNLASRLQTLAEPGTVYLSEATQRLVQGLVETTFAGAHPVKGKAEPQKVHDQHAVEPGERALGRLETEQAKQQADIFRGMQPEHGQPHFELAHDLALGFARSDLKRSAHYLDKGQKGCLPAVRRTASRQDEGLLLADALAEFV
jgi:hypothetical protein